MLNTLFSPPKKRFTLLTAYLLISQIVVGQNADLINGYVVDDESSQALAGANVIIKGSGSGSISGEDGSFDIAWNGPYPITLIVSYIGYRTEERMLSAPAPVAIRMKSVVLKGELITIMGTRTGSDRDVSSSSEVVSIRRVEERGIRDATEILQEMESVNVATSSWGKQHISIRGSNANEVSVYMDGVKMNRAVDGIANLSFIDLSELAQIEVLRGGSSVLFGPGNFGGVVLLHSKQPEKLDIQLNRSIGLSNNTDQDLSGGLSMRLGPVGTSGRFSGKSRLYDGRTLHTAFYNSAAADLDLSSFHSSVRRMEVSNTIKYPSGAILSSDKMLVDRIGLYGELPIVGDWYAQGGDRHWTWEDNFFSNLSRNLSDQSRSVRLGKGFSWNNFSGTLQWEQEEKSYITDQIISDIESDQQWFDSATLTHDDRGFAGVLRYSVKQPVKDVETIRWEMGLRNSTSKYVHNQNIDRYNNFIYMETTKYDIETELTLSTFRIGAYISGKLGGADYIFFFNQGTNHRPPTLNDQLLRGTTLIWSANLEDNANDTQLLKEYVTNTELNAEVTWDNLNTKPISRWEFGIGVFRNYYLDKIVYQSISENIVVPYNIDRAWINGMEFRWKGTTWNRIIELSANMTTLFPSAEEVFPNKPTLQGNVILDIRYKRLRLNIGHLYQGRQSYLLRGIDLQKISSHTNTNLTVSYQRQVWRLKTTVSYTIRNVFSEKVTLVDTAHPEYENFNYFDAHRSLLTLKFSLHRKTDEE
ncbi:MAG: TonB-dependent receptor plug domain-containing protein [Candidatus Marinimicrobia bacterium]|jgi:outer membrane receptor protein involved in Fe transport|nr:TonB-dependent receptor plug domain-containing protein [Candidatus Neomarinimicrobiota bacterium]